MLPLRLQFEESTKQEVMWPEAHPSFIYSLWLHPNLSNEVTKEKKREVYVLPQFKEKHSCAFSV